MNERISLHWSLYISCSLNSGVPRAAYFSREVEGGILRLCTFGTSGIFLYSHQKVGSRLVIGNEPVCVCRIVSGYFACLQSAMLFHMHILFIFTLNHSFRTDVFCFLVIPRYCSWLWKSRLAPSRANSSPVPQLPSIHMSDTFFVPTRFSSASMVSRTSTKVILVE